MEMLPTFLYLQLTYATSRPHLASQYSFWTWTARARLHRKFPLQRNLYSMLSGFSESRAVETLHAAISYWMSIVEKFSFRVRLFLIKAHFF